jgi:membrane associated rhomboid family serine protease
MSWYERDYAHKEPAGGSFGSRAAALWGGSIVKQLIVANVVVYVLCYVIQTPLSPLLSGQLRRSGFAVVYEPGLCEMITAKVLQGQVWRMITSQYLHSQRIEHILFNMMGLYFLGKGLEQVWGNRKFFLIYTLSGICGNLLLVAAGLAGWISPYVPAVGASGCVLGLLGAAAVLFPRAELLVYMLFPIRIRTAATLFALMYAWNVYRQGDNYGGDLCHLAGLAFGVGYARWGEAWWARPGLRRGSVGRHVSEPDTAGPSTRATGVDAEEVDRLLRKVYEGGILSLTPQEKLTLREASERRRQEELRAQRGG